ncbi:hypothetical protein CR513_13742, partial [Mucuna pruriens]
MGVNTNRIVSLNDTNYHLWKVKMKDLLFMKNMHLPVFVAQKPESMSDKNRTLSINKYVVLSDFLWIIMFTITLQGLLIRCQECASSLKMKFWDYYFGILYLNLRRLLRSLSQIQPLMCTWQGDEKEGTREKSEKGREKSINTRIWSITIVTKKGIFRSIVSYEKRRTKAKRKDDNDDDDDNEDRVTIVTCDDLVILRDFESVNLVSDESMWIIDSGATLHVTSRKEFFTSYTLGDFGVLKIGNDGVTKVIGVGDVYLQTNIGMQLWLRGVKHAPNKLTKGNLVVAKGEKFFKLYWTKALVAKDIVNHRRLSHINEKWLNYLAKKDMFPGLKNEKLDKCSHCMAGKQTRVFFEKHPPSRKSKLLELVYSDVCGPLKSKDQVLKKFKHFQALVERQSGKKVKCICSNNSGEYCGPFDVYCKQQGIKNEKTPPKTP